MLLAQLTHFDFSGLLAMQAYLDHVVQLMLGTFFLLMFSAIKGSAFKKAMCAAFFAPLCFVLLLLIASVWLRLPG